MVEEVGVEDLERFAPGQSIAGGAWRQERQYARTIDDRSRQRTRRSRIHSCRETAHGLECGVVNAQLGLSAREVNI